MGTVKNGESDSGVCVVRAQDYDRMSLEDLCKPVSGRVMPGHAIYTISGTEMSPQQAVFAGRRASGSTRNKGRKA